jgi:hypothetical protein
MGHQPKPTTTRKTTSYSSNRKHTIQIGDQTRPTTIGKAILVSKNRRQIVDMQH